MANDDLTKPATNPWWTGNFNKPVLLSDLPDDDRKITVDCVGGKYAELGPTEGPITEEQRLWRRGAMQLYMASPALRALLDRAKSTRLTEDELPDLPLSERGFGINGDKP